MPIFLLKSKKVGLFLAHSEKFSKFAAGKSKNIPRAAFTTAIGQEKQLKLSIWKD